MSSVAHENGPLWLVNPVQAQEIARRMRRPVLVDFWAPDCSGCRRMGQETFAHPEVATLLRDEFITLRVDTSAVTEAQRPLVRTFRLLWTPDILFLDPSGAALTRRLGFHPPAEFLAILHLALGQAAMSMKDLLLAATRFARAAEIPGAVEARPEALFWAGIVARLRDGRADPAALDGHWCVLGRDYGDTLWWQRALASAGREATQAPG